MASIQIDGYELKRGNFQIFADIIGNERLAETFYNMEKYYQTDRPRFAGNMRLAIEAFAAAEYLRLHPEDEYDLRSKMNLAMQTEKLDNQQATELNGAVKIFLALQCCEQAYLPYFQTALDSFRIWAQNRAPWCLRNLYSPNGIKRLITQMYAFASCPHHDDTIGVKPQEIYEATEENCNIFCKVFYYFLRAYCQIHFPATKNSLQIPFDDQLCPLRDYIPLSKGSMKAVGLQKLKGKRYFIQEKDGVVRYFLLCDVDEDQSFSREVEVLRNIWADDNDFEPNNIIRFREEIHINEYEKKLVFSLPSKPSRLTPAALQSLSVKMKLKIYKDALRAIASLHGNIPSYYHRDITPEAFILCTTRSGYKLFLNAFDCVKDTDEHAVRTVGTIVANNRGSQKKIPYIAPEILDIPKDSQAWKDADWEKADIYALGMLGVFIFTGGTDLQALEDAPEVDERTKVMIRRMCAPAESRLTVLL